MSDRIIVINELELLVQQCFSTLDDLLLIQKFSENDARVTFFKHIVNVIDSSIIFLVTAHRYFGDESWWNDTHECIIYQNAEYLLIENLIIVIRRFQCLISFLFSSFEHSIRQIIYV